MTGTVLQQPRQVPRAVWWSAGLLALWAAVLGMVLTRDGLAEADVPVLHWLEGHRSGPLTTVFELVSGTVPDGAAALLAGAVVLLAAVRSRSLRPLLTLAAAVGAAVVLAEGLKAVVDRARPATGAMLGVPETGSGFPSAHTLVITALAGATALVVWRTTASRAARVVVVVLALAASAAMGASRLYLGDHWLTDVLASYVLGGLVVTVTAALTPPSGRSGPG